MFLIIFLFFLIAKMLLDPMGGVVITNDGNCILREVDVSHPTAKSMIELSRSQDEEVGDGTTSVIILAGEMMMKAGPFITNNLHPTVIVQGYNKALQEALLICERYVHLPAFCFYFRELNRIETNFCNSPLYHHTFLAKHW
jgi:hypothetical protein